MSFDTSGVKGIDADLVVRPFGRKGEFATTRAFDRAALQFHMGMQPVEVVGADTDALSTTRETGHSRVCSARESLRPG